MRSNFWPENIKLSIELAKKMGRPLSIFPRDPENLKLEDLPFVVKELAPSDPEIICLIRTTEELRSILEVGARFGIIKEENGLYHVAKWR